MEVLVRLALLIAFFAAGPIAAQAASDPSKAPSIMLDPKAVKPTREDLMATGPLGDQTLGDPKAPVTVIEYASMTCSHCGRFHREVFQDFKKKYIDTGKVYFILREFPLDPLSTAAFMLARCAPGGQFFPMVELLFEKQDQWAYVDDPGPALFKTVQPMGFTETTFQACLAKQDILDDIGWIRSRAEGKLGVDATPTFFFNSEKKMGELSMAEIDEAIKAATVPAP